MNHLVIKIENGVVADIWHTEPLLVTIVDYDVIEPGDGLEQRMRKAVLSQPSGPLLPADALDALVRSLVAACSRPAPPVVPGAGMEQRAA